MNKKRIIVGLVVVVLAVLIVWLIVSQTGTSRKAPTLDDPANIVLNFYEPWISAASSTSTDPYAINIIGNNMLDTDLQTRLLEDHSNPDNQIDPVLCGISAKGSLSARPIFQNEEEAQVLVMSAEVGQSAQVVVTIVPKDDKWIISDIECSAGEFAPEREFSFEQRGFILRDSLPEPLDSSRWHIVFEQEGQAGYTVPLYFDTGSICVSANGTEAVCDENKLTEATEVIIKGGMSEVGADVSRLEIVGQ